MSAVPYHLIDAFTRERFAGNPAAVVHFAADDARAQDSQLLLKVAREFNLSETAFLLPLKDVEREFAAGEGGQPDPSYSLRWFTPSVEFPLCGHATLASAHALFSTRHLDARRLRFETMSGTLFAARLEDGRIELDFPADQDVLERNENEADKVASLVEQAHAELSQHVVAIAVGRLGGVVELDASFDLQHADIDAKPLAASSRYFVFTQAAHVHFPQHAVYSRVFDGAEDIPEDPVTGSAHCILAPYYLSPTSPGFKSIESSTHRGASSFSARQGGSRQGELEVVWDEERGRVKLRGCAVTVMDGSLSL
ncbi:uncharacterized protein RHOBADRAFT_51794 [Rhodotorula graminis WP1]|uniref:Phenazine biosynthesis PhzC/PhzF protein n=1 Tax=Rhodotorula graminis (strain WP1) TaxID=578459 RepID=A0A194S8B1_RHOGW|nr:uncharacterized protein RHOBADRAFT_51794 [Rhodotorula graminis WP1]KPV76804.1 hypothetical protein RHOBADRAFT_51794 [Rhodotorula graminis WP1]